MSVRIYGGGGKTIRDATATAADIRKGKVAYINGHQRVVGSSNMIEIKQATAMDVNSDNPIEPGRFVEFEDTPPAVAAGDFIQAGEMLNETRDWTGIGFYNDYFLVVGSTSADCFYRVLQYANGEWTAVADLLDGEAAAYTCYYDMGYGKILALRKKSQYIMRVAVFQYDAAAHTLTKGTVLDIQLSLSMQYGGDDIRVVDRKENCFLCYYGQVSNILFSLQVNGMEITYGTALSLSYSSSYPDTYGAWLRINYYTLQCVDFRYGTKAKILQIHWSGISEIGFQKEQITEENIYTTTGKQYEHIGIHNKAVLIQTRTGSVGGSEGYYNEDIYAYDYGTDKKITPQEQQEKTRHRSNDYMPGMIKEGQLVFAGQGIQKAKFYLQAFLIWKSAIRFLWELKIDAYALGQYYAADNVVRVVGYAIQGCDLYLFWAGTDYNNTGKSTVKVMKLRGAFRVKEAEKSIDGISSTEINQEGGHMLLMEGK